MFSLIRASQGPKQTFAAVPSCAAVGVRTKQESAGAELGLENGKIVSFSLRSAHAFHGIYQRV